MAENVLPVTLDGNSRLCRRSGQVRQSERQLRVCPVDLLRPPAKEMERRPPAALAPSLTPSEDCWVVRLWVEARLGWLALGEATLPKDCLERALERVIILHK